MPRLTKRTVDAAKPQDRERIIWDEALSGFGLRVLPSGRRSYLIQYRAHGRTRRFALGPHGVLTPANARRKAARLLADVREGADPSAERQAGFSAPTVAELAERYLREHADAKKKPSSARTDRGLLRLYVLPALRRRRIADLTRNDVLTFHHSLRATPTAANRALALLSKLCSLAERWGLRRDAINPCRGVERYKERPRARYLSTSELTRLGATLAAFESDGLEPAEAIAAVRLLIFTGARRSEILTLKWPMVDFERACLRLDDSKTGAKVITLNAPALALLAKLGRRSEWVLPTAHGRSPISLSKPWTRIRCQAGLEDVRIHDLRHAFASVGVGVGTTLYVIGKLLGHKTPSVTARYAHLSDDPLRAASEAIGARIAAAMNNAPAAEVVALRQEGPRAS